MCARAKPKEDQEEEGQEELRHLVMYAARDRDRDRDCDRDRDGMSVSVSVARGASSRRFWFGLRVMMVLGVFHVATPPPVLSSPPATRPRKQKA